MKIAICTLAGDPNDVSTWSGTPAHFIHGLRSTGAEVVGIGPLQPLFYRALNKLSGLTGRLGHKLNWESEPFALRLFTKALDTQLARIRPDVVILMGWFPMSSRSDVPMFFWGDATIGQRIGLSPHWSHLSRRTSAAAPRIEAKCLEALAGTFWSSNWAREDAIARYGLSNTNCVPFASNLDDPHACPKSIGANQPIELLSVGVKWHRKGIDTAVQATDILVSQGVDAHLNVVGVLPPDSSWNRKYVTYHGRLWKDRPSEANRLHSLYSSADVFVLPTRNEPFGIVFQEAAAYALPVVASRVGGVPETVEDGSTGLTIPEHSGPKEYAAAISRLINNDGLYASMSRLARQRYEERFTWDTVAKRVLTLVQDHQPENVTRV